MVEYDIVVKNYYIDSNNIIREKIEPIPLGWDETLYNGEQRFRTYSYFSTDEVRSAGQKAARRGWTYDCVQWFLELFWTSPADRTNAWNRLLVISTEDIGPADPDAFLQVYKLFKNYKDDPIALATSAAIVSQRVKTRVNDWAFHYIIHYETPVDKSNMEFYQNLSTAMNNKDTFNCLLNTHYLCCSTKPLTSEERSIKQTRYKKAKWLIWVAFESIIGSNNRYLNNISELCLSPTWRWNDRCRLFHIHIIHLWCNNILPGETIDKPIIFEPYQEFAPVVNKLKQRVEQVGIPDIAIDMHTNRGKNNNRNIKHFISEGGKLINYSENWSTLEKWYIDNSKFKL